ncbi:MAG TPA: hypothetical protein VMB50_14190 [Myxococcales bacterium]|nr:hypothetical protein [Myxococcales bacterium]
MRRTVRPLCFSALAGLAACATLAAGPPPTTRAEQAVEAALDEAQAAFVKHDGKAIAQALALARAEAGDDVALADRAADVGAAWDLDSDDVHSAVHEMESRLVAARDALSAQGLHDKLIFLCEAARDPQCAVLEAVEMTAAAERAPPPLPVHTRLGNLWQRAHTLRALAATLPEPLRGRAVRYAQEAREAFAALARQTQQSLPSIDILSEQFAAADGDCATPVLISKGLDPAALDPQDAYITYAALETCGERDLAGPYKQKILANDRLRLFPAVYRYLARQPWPPNLAVATPGR